ncbi:PREDICTED: activin receptor type-2A isoform X1 [Nicrophorus vespilloides]|uniref:Serine/threonine-protein kinase receptor n=1 Tax=Nicrophorus vespilloides TaxID=110193 RepID=A0ABM1N6A0_NICVS|nr:PREDICTED: activin receptor type-2A isoform X1 [Nicrophorus vespilloides]
MFSTRRFFEFLSMIIFYLLIQNDCCSSNAASAMISQSHVRQKAYCEYFNRSLCNESRMNGQEDGCNERTEECSTLEGKTHCFVVWKQTEGNVSVELKGCFANKDCNETRCVESSEEPNKEFLYCCCAGSMCNKDFFWEPKPRVIKPKHQEPELVKNSNWLVLIQVLIFVIVFLISAFGIWYFFVYGKKSLFNEWGLPTIEPNPLPSPSPLLGKRSIQLVEVKARGRFGAVWKAKFKSEEVAVKVFPVQDKQSWLQEQEIFKLPNMEHANILHFIGVEKHNDNLKTEFWLITAYHEIGSLCDFLKANTLSWTDLCKVVETMARGLMHLHEEIPGRLGMPTKPAVAHRDFKSKNVLLKSNMTACIADFGLALVFESGKSCGDTHGQVGTRRYMGPEVLEGAINFTPDAFLRIDMYACGLVLWELVSRCTEQDGPVPEYRLPFEEEVGQHPTLEDMQEAVVQRKVRPTIPESWRNNPALSALCETMEECWDHDAEARLSASCVMERVLHQSRYRPSSLTMRIENEALRSPTKENSM